MSGWVLRGLLYRRVALWARSMQRCLCLWAGGRGLRKTEGTEGTEGGRHAQRTQNHTSPETQAGPAQDAQDAMVPCLMAALRIRVRSRTCIFGMQVWQHQS